VGLSNLLPLRNVSRERARSASADLGWTISGLELNASVFGSDIRDPIMLRLPAAFGGPLEIVNAANPTHTIGTEFLARRRFGDFGVTFTHTYLHSTEVDPNDPVRREVPLTTQTCSRSSRHLGEERSIPYGCRSVLHGISATR
jgi:outer membrane cobalamin receptor